MRTNHNPSLFLRRYGCVFDKLEAKLSNIKIECFFVIVDYEGNQTE